MKYSIIGAVLLALVGVVAFSLLGGGADVTARTEGVVSSTEPSSVSSDESPRSKAKAVASSQRNVTTSKKAAVESSGDDLVVSAEMEERYQVLSENDNFPTLSSKLNAIQQRRPGTAISPEDILSAMAKSKAWEVKDDPGILAHKLSDVELNDGREFIHFDPVKVETLMTGDHMDIENTEMGLTFDMRVDHVKNFGDGNIMWKGTIVNHDGGTVSITQSPKMTVGSVILPEVDFTLASYGEDGWVVDSSVLFKIDPDHIDTITLEE